MPSRSTARAASRCTGRISGLPLSVASELADCTASCAFSVNLSQRIAILYSFLLTDATLSGRRGGDCFTRPPLSTVVGPLFGLGGFPGLALERFAPEVDFDLLRTGFSALGQVQLQEAVLILRLHIVGVDRVGQSEAAGERAIAPLDA